MMTEINKSVAVSDNFQELLRNLVGEPFSVSNGFLDLTLEEIGLILEEPIDETSQLIEIHNSCKSTFCLLLIELELCGYETIPAHLLEHPLKTLCEIVDGTDSTTQKISELKASQIIEERKIILDEEENTRLNPILEIVPPQQTVKETNLESDFTEMARWFINQTSPSAEWPVSTEACQRSAIHFLLAASDISIFQKMKHGIHEMWPTRAQSIQSLLNPNEFKFNENILSKIALDEKSNSELLFDGKFPKLAALHCLKYLTLSNSLESLHFSTFELGILIYFWGTQLPLWDGEASHANSLKLSEDQAIQIAFRLFKLDRIKANADNFNRLFVENYFQSALNDTQSIKKIFDDVLSQSFVKEVA